MVLLYGRCGPRVYMYIFHTRYSMKHTDEMWKWWAQSAPWSATAVMHLQSDLVPCYTKHVTDKNNQLTGGLLRTWWCRRRRERHILCISPRGLHNNRRWCTLFWGFHRVQPDIKMLILWNDTKMLILWNDTKMLI